MAIIYRAEIRPTKLELLGAWLPEQSWFVGAADARLERVGAYRFDDPAGEVGVETILVRAGDGPVLQVPLTYRGAPLPGAETWLITTMEHSVLGKRWVYDACADPVYVSALVATILSGGTQADEHVQGDGGSESRKASVSVKGSGSPGRAIPSVDQVEDLSCATDDAITVCAAGDVEVGVRRIVDPSAEVAAGEHRLTGTWSGQDEPVLLATARRG